VHDILFWVNKDNPRGGSPVNPADDPQFALWEYPVQRWARNNPQSFPVAQTPTASPSPPEQTRGLFAITSPQKGTGFSAFVPIRVTASHTLPERVLRVAYYLNGRFVGSSTAPPYAVSFMPVAYGPVTLRAVAESSLGSQEQAISFTIQ
jgi:hypothetical protein